MRRSTLAAAAIAVAAAGGCDQPKLTGPDPGEVEATDGGTKGAAVRATLPRADAEDLVARLLPTVESGLAQKLRGLLDKERIGAEEAQAALRTLDETPGIDRDPEVGAVRVTLDAILRVLALRTGSTETVTK
jgi:hypothetical protein